jgi:choline-glycine betaine transporter
VGDLRRRRPGDRLRHLPPRPPPADQLAAFEPLFGKRRTEGPAGKVIDVLAIFATLFGSAASLGLGALQIGSGLEILGWAGRSATASWSRSSRC